MKKLKKNKSTIVGILVFILVLAGIFAMKSVMSSDEAKAIYGSRLDGMKDVEITNETTDKVEKKLSSEDYKKFKEILEELEDVSFRYEGSFSITMEES